MNTAELTPDSSAVLDKYGVTVNACRMCTPLGACVVFKGIKGAVPFIHGSQGCATYIRRYLISHYKEPVDIASSSFSEETAIFGGKDNLLGGIENVIKQYKPEFIGIASTCLSETIGDDVPGILRNSRDRFDKSCRIVSVSTPSYKGSHIDGFRSACRTTVESLAEKGTPDGKLNLFPGFISPADLRHLKEILADFGISGTVFPDYSETLDGGMWSEYKRVPPGGTPVGDIAGTANASLSIEFSNICPEAQSPAHHLKSAFGVKAERIMIPVGIDASDRFMEILKKFSGNEIPEKYLAERARLIDAYTDGHKYVSGRKAVVYGEPDLVLALAGFLKEIGVEPAVLALSSRSPGFRETAIACGAADKSAVVLEETDYEKMTEAAELAKPDFIIGNSKGFKMAAKLNVPILRVGFPVHDRFGGARLSIVSYRGTQRLFDDVVNTVIARIQNSSDVGYMYI